MRKHNSLWHVLKIKMTKKNKVIVKYKEYTRIHSFFSISYNLNNKFNLTNNELNDKY